MSDVVPEVVCNIGSISCVKTACGEPTHSGSRTRFLSGVGVSQFSSDVKLTSTLATFSDETDLFPAELHVCTDTGVETIDSSNAFWTQGGVKEGRGTFMGDGEGRAPISILTRLASVG